MKMHHVERRNKASEVLKKAGYGKMKHLVEEGVHEHEKALHKGKKETKLKLATGGHVKGEKPKDRLDRKPRASGGRNKHHKEPKIAVNVINAGKQPVPVPTPMGGGMPQRPPMPPSPPMGAAPPPGAGAPQMAGAPRPSMPGQMPPRPGMGGLKTGGRARRADGGALKMRKDDVPHLEGGSGGGLGRLEKAEHESKRKVKFK